MQIFLLRSAGLERANKILVSSEKIIGVEVLFIILGKSFILIYKRNSRCPRTEPCGTPCLTLAQFYVYYFSHCHYILLFYNNCYPDKIDTV